MNESHKDDFKKLANFYDKIIHKKNKIFWKDKVNIQKSGTILDIGGGTGRILENFQDLASHLYICDFSLSMLNKAKQKKNFLKFVVKQNFYHFPVKHFKSLLWLTHYII